MMRILDPVFALDHYFWYRRYKANAASDPRWAEIEALRDTYSGENTTVMLDHDHGLTMDLWIEQNDIALALTPHTFLHHLRWWLEEHPGFDRPLRTLRTFWLRGRHGWAPSDAVFGLDAYLSRVISEAVIYLRDHGHGYPVDLTEDEWAKTLTAISEGFRDYLNEDEGGERFATAMQLLAERFKNLWD